MDPNPTTLAKPNISANVVSDTEIQVSWTSVTNATMYRLERQPVGGAFTQITTTADLQHADVGLTPNTVYNYRVVATAGSIESDASDPVSAQTAAEARVDLIGNLTADRTLDSDTVYVLKGVVQVQSGVTLTIEPGTTILGDKATQGTLLVLQGGILVADGTSADPIVFTSGQSAGSRSKGDWGGVVINGRSNCNDPSGNCLGEGNTGAYGGNDTADSSGVIRYVRIEFAGIEFSPNNELNGLTLNGVGSGTVIEYVQVHAGLDDGIELFGGTVDIKYAVTTQISDDSFDWSTGWQGRGQFWIAQHDPNDSDNAFEVDNNPDDNTATPRTNGMVYNFTLIGKPDPSGSGSDLGILFREGYQGTHSCGVVMGMGKAGLDIDHAETETQANLGNLTLTQTTFYMNGQEESNYVAPLGITFDPDQNDLDTTRSDFEEVFADTTNGTNGILIEDPMLADPFNLTSPDFSPAAGSPLINGGCAPPNDGWFDHTVTYRGAVADANDTWYLGWTAFPAN